MPTYEELGEKLKFVAAEKSEWAGLPMMVDGFALTLEPRYPYQFPSMERPDDDPFHEKRVPSEIVNHWHSDKFGQEVYIVRQGGRLTYTLEPGENRLTLLFNTLGASRAWLISAEEKAIVKLRELITDYQMRCYQMTGTFLESSKRSKTTYVFRRLRPTIAVTTSGGNVKGLCALCRHSVGYYKSTHAGCLVPTDDVIAALVFMRGDEHKFWQGSTQHPLYRAEAGV